MKKKAFQGQSSEIKFPDKKRKGALGKESVVDFKGKKSPKKGK